MKQNNTIDHSNLYFNRQWYLSKNKPSANFKWDKYLLVDGYTLYAHVNQKVFLNRIDRASGVVVVGIAFNPESLDDFTLSPLSQKAQNSQEFVNEIIQLAGSYVIINYSPGKIKIYNDPAGLMGVYFSKTAVASTPTLITPLVRDRAIDLDFQFKAGNDWYTGTTTPYVDVQKLIPNCSYDLIDCCMERYWPTSDYFSEIKTLNVEEIISNITNLLKKMMAGIVIRGNVLASITGGQDSRVVLAASKPVWDKINYFTLQGIAVQQNDVIFARLLAEKAKLTHQVYEILPTENWVYELYDSISAGESIGARREIAGTCLQLAGPDVIHVNGNLGAICKTYYWDRKEPTHFNIPSVLRDFVSPGQITVAGVEEWRKTVPNLKPAVLYNLFYLEQRGGRWISAGENCSRLFYESFTPFNHRELFSLICSLPVSLQYGGDLLRILTKEMAPELLDVPFCKIRRSWTKYIPEKVKIKIRKFVKK